MVVFEEIIDFENHIQPKFTEQVYNRSKHLLKENVINDTNISLTQLRSGMVKHNDYKLKKDIIEVYELIPTGEGKIEVGIFYNPDVKSKRNRQTCLFIHGGGFVGGNFHQYKNQCKLIAQNTDSVVFALNYHLSPEVAFPVALNDCAFVYDWIETKRDCLNIDLNNFYIIADSAGVSLGLGLCKIKKIHVKKFFNFYGCIDLMPESNDLYKWSIDKFPIIEDQYELLVRKLNKFSQNMNFFKDCYIQDIDDEKNTLISIVYEENFDYIPDMVYFEAEFDYFKISNRYFCNKLKSYKDIIIYSYKGLDHGFLEHLSYYPETEDALLKLSNIINES